MLRRSDGRVTALSEGFSDARDPDVSFDGQRILFAAKRSSNDRWQIYEMTLDGGDVRQITREPMDCRSPGYQSYFFVITADQPWRQITFVGSRDGAAPNLYSARMDGAQVRQITFNPFGATDPYLMQDGRILFASRQSNRLETGHAERLGIFGVNLDGTDYAAFALAEGAPWKRMPAVADNRLAVFVENTRWTPDGSGWLAAVTLRRNQHSHRRLTAPEDGLYHSPSPLDETSILASRRPSGGGGTFGLYRLPLDGGEPSLIHDDPERHDIQARIVAPRPEPDGRSSVVDEAEPAGVLYCLNVNINDLENKDWLPPGSARRLRVLEGIPAFTPDAGAPLPALRKRMLGEIDLAKDGSFHIRVPANLPLELQLLGEHGMALRSCSWIWVKNREPRGCIGCHEDGELTPENRLVEAVARPAIQLTLPPERRRTVTFTRDVQPIFERSCASASCHGGAAAPQVMNADQLRTRVAGAARLSPLVWSLFGQDLRRPWDDGAVAKPVSLMPPEGASPLTEDEKRTIIEWIDMGAQTR